MPEHATVKCNCIMPSGEERFKYGWKLICKTWNSQNRHCLEFGSGRDTLSHWVNKTCKEHHSSYFYRMVLNEAVKRGYAIKKKSTSGYSIFLIDNVSRSNLIEKYTKYFELGAKDKYFTGMFRWIKYSYVRVTNPYKDGLFFNIYCYGCLVDDFIASKIEADPLKWSFIPQSDLDLYLKRKAEDAIAAFIDSH